jgi:hypothetical protein
VGLLEFLRGNKRVPDPALEAYLTEVTARPPRDAVTDSDPAEYESGRTILEQPPAAQATTLAAAWGQLGRVLQSNQWDYKIVWALRGLVSALQRKRPPLSVEQLITVLEDAVDLYVRYRSWMSVVGFVAGAESVPATERPPRLVRALEKLRDALRDGTGDDKRLADRIDVALKGAAPVSFARTGPLGRRVAADLDDATMPAPLRAAWTSLLAHGMAVTAAKPTARWLKQAGPLLDAVGRAEAAARLRGWLELGPCPGEAAGTRATDLDADLLRGMLFAAAALGDAALAPAVATLAAASLRKIPNLGPVSARVGNSGINVLAELPGPAAITQLGRLRLLVKYATARRLVEKALETAARRAGVTADEIEEMSVPTYGLDASGVARTELGDVTAELAIADDEATLVFRGAGGKLFKSVPASVKQDHPAALAELRRTVKEIGQVLPAQRLRLENLMIGGRELTVEQWRARYLEHPLVGDMARRLIWSVVAAGAVTSVMRLDGKYVDGNGASTDVPAEARVRLFHPLRAAVEETLAWRRLLESRELTQPFKQAHREIYVVTDAELATGTYSNRFAGHILRQHQLAALCRDRGWQYRLQGGFDSANNPYLQIPGTNVTVELWTEAPHDQASPMSGAGIFLHVATDQVRFSEGGQAVPVAQIPPLIFSEIMRDVDLFVSVASIGTDPTWNDQGERRPFDEYWRAFAFGELSASAKTRRAVLESIVPKLKIRDRCSFDERHLVVRGELATYRIHLGSGNILIEPGSRYLCIVPDNAKRGDRVTLPFKGDGLLAVILSKAFLLAADRDIKDASIVRQIRA